MPAAAPPHAPARPPIPGPLSVGYWVAAVIVYGLIGTRLPQAVFLGFWQSIPYVLVLHWARPRVLGAVLRLSGRAA